MKFSKTSGLEIPEYPYKQLKKVIKLRQHDAFSSILNKDVLQIGIAWKKQAERVFFKAFLRRQNDTAARAGKPLLAYGQFVQRGHEEDYQKVQ